MNESYYSLLVMKIQDRNRFSMLRNVILGFLDEDDPRLRIWSSNIDFNFIGVLCCSLVIE